MSIFVQQPRKRKGLSGLGAFNQLLPAIRERGVAAIADADWACNYDMIYASVYDELSRMPMYRSHSDALRTDAASHAHAIWLARCPQASYTINEFNNYYDRGGVWGERRHHGGGHHHHGGGGHAPMHYAAAPSSSARSMANAPMRHVAQPTGTRPMAPTPVHYAAAPPSAAHSMTQPTMSYRGPARSAAHMAPRQAHSHRGLGDATLDPSVTRRLQQQLQASGTTSTVVRSVVPTSVQQMQEAVHQQVSSAVSAAVETSPMPMSMPTIEGALPTAVAGLLGIGVGLTVMSMFVGK